LYFCASKASKLSTCSRQAAAYCGVPQASRPRFRRPRASMCQHLRQYLYFCTHKASKLRSTCVSVCTFF
jgi:hypothetical protein